MSSTYSPSTSHPNTPSAEQASWGANASPNLPGSGTWSTNTGSYPWGSVWNENSRKDPPARLTEVLPTSPSATRPGSKGVLDGRAGQTQGAAHTEATLPFSIPLQPVLKPYRSSSYSVGQNDTSGIGLSTILAAAPADSHRSRFSQLQGSGSLQRRSSRPGMLYETGVLEKVKETDDDEERAQDLMEREDSQAQKISQLEKENAKLRQAAQGRERIISSTGSHPATSFRDNLAQRSLPEEAVTIDDGDDIRQRLTHATREQSNIYAERGTYSSQDVRAENGRKPHWQTSLGFGTLAEPPQSRRHSFAEIPTRHGSISSTGKPSDIDPRPELETETSDHNDVAQVYDSAAQNQVDSNTEGEFRFFPSVHAFSTCSETQMLIQPPFVAHYFNTHSAARHGAEVNMDKSHATANPYGRYQGTGSTFAPEAQSLYIVTFKCMRADVFYIQEGTGLQVSEGVLVIVEADRGTDLGSVAHANVTWEQARYFKEHYAEEHYKLLMMYSMQARNGGPNVVNPNGLQGTPGSAVGGMGPPGHHTSHENAQNDLKPKMIKRQAQPHEFQMLAEKEGNEAKAKRLCQQKVQEHGLHMEILDAEFQMWVFQG